MSKIDEHKNEVNHHAAIAAYFDNPSAIERPTFVTITSGFDIRIERSKAYPPYSARECLCDALREMLPAIAARAVAIHAEQVERLRLEAMRECEDFVANGGRLSAPITLPAGEEVEDEEGEA